MYVPDAFKIDIIRFFDSPAGKAFVLALQKRMPPYPVSGADHSHTLLDMYAIRQGYEKCLEEIPKIPQESEPRNEADEKERILLDPAD